MPGFFATHGGYAQTTFDAAPTGLYRCRLKEIVPEERPAWDDPNVIESVYKVVFETTEAADSNGRPFRFFVSPRRIGKDGGGTYGIERAALTKLLDGMLGRRLSADEFENLDLDELLTRTYEVMVEQRPGSNGKPPRNKVLTVVGVVSAGKAQGGSPNRLSSPRPVNGSGGGSATTAVAERPRVAAAGAAVAIADRDDAPPATEADDLSDLDDPFVE